MNTINLLPWRKTKRDQLKRKRLFFALSVATIVFIVLVFTHYWKTQSSYRKVMRHSKRQAVNLASYKKRHHHFNAKFRKITPKAGQQSLDSLHYIGLIKNESEKWALLSQSDGLVSIVITGDYLGKERGRVVQIRERTIEIEKTMWSRQGLVKTSVLLSLRQKEN